MRINNAAGDGAGIDADAIFMAKISRARARGAIFAAWLAGVARGAAYAAQRAVCWRALRRSRAQMRAPRSLLDISSA